MPLDRRLRVDAAALRAQPLRNLPQMWSSTTNAMKSRLRTSTVVGPLWTQRGAAVSGVWRGVAWRGTAAGGQRAPAAAAAAVLGGAREWRRGAHLQARRVVRVEAQDARAAAAAALRPAARGRPARRAAARHRAARFGGGRASGTLGQHAAGGPGARLPLTSLRARRHSSVNCAEIEQRRARRRRVQTALPLAAQLPLRCGGRVR